MSNALKLKNEFNPVILSQHARDCYEFTHTIISNTLYNIPEKYIKPSLEIKVRMHLEYILFGANTTDTLDDMYASLNPQNKVLANGIFFKTFFREYAARLNINLNNIKIQPTVYYTARLFTVKDETELKKLLENVWQLIPVIYTTQRDTEPQQTYDSNKTIAETAKENPAFVPNSLRARFVNDIQIDAVRKLHNIFKQVVNMTTSVNTK